MRTNKSRMLIAAAAVAASTYAAAGRADAQVHVDIAVPLPSISFSVAPHLIALPGTYAYVVPDYEAELFFYDGFWWRPYQGRWYRSAYYDRGWEIWGGVPVFYGSVPRDWRVRYRNRDWDGHRWDYERVSYDDVRTNWSSWKRDRHWDRTVRDAGRPDNRYEKSKAGPDSRVDGRDGRVEQRSSERRVEQRSTAPRAEKSAPSQRSQGANRGPARVEKSQSPSRSQSPSKARSQSGARGSGGGDKGQGGAQKSGDAKGGDAKGGDKGHK